MAITASQVKELREMTGVGMMDCKSALIEADGDMDRAVEILREKGLAAAAKKAGRVASQGIVDAYIHGGGRIGVLVEVNCETDFVANTAEFRSFVHDIAMQIAAANPRYVAKEDVPADVLEKEKEILRQQAINEGKPENILDKIIDGRIDKFYKEVCLLEQPFIRDTDRAVKDIVTAQITKFGENINIRRFTRYEMGEGLEKVASCQF
ncbi:translation elongation factor Ts [Mahella sp.]|uniref:translation elongation factor Ts n=1 Tax=Mahella sp. TaxID=2798721 RepID=UPI0025C2F082|nr:translation elongation factor Ts [Mahella sp.]MBZ4665354.1 translation elongation factor Ts (EF-Ts) [Mahella sp.]